MTMMEQDIDLLPCSLAIIKAIQCIPTSIPFQVSFDSGSDNTFIHQKALPPGATLRIINQRQGQTLAGLLHTSQEVNLQEILLPKFSCSCRVDNQHTFVFAGQCNYDIIFGRNLLRKIGLKHDFDIGLMTAFDVTIEMKQKSFYTNSFLALANIQEVNDDKRNDCFHSTQILQSKYDRADVKTVTLQQTHLSPSQQEELQTILSQQNKIFFEKDGHYKHKKMDLELLPGAKPIQHAKPYPIPRTQRDIFQKELEHLVQLGVCALPTLIIPKKDQRVRWVSDFCEVNKVICHKIYPLPLI
jgi:hypothetical protein